MNERLRLKRSHAAGFTAWLLFERLRQRLERVLSATRCANERREPPQGGGSP
ncbi:hypothetical protein [Komarekiella delphini-convector]|uniref:hypothetical protein n=1 Tax=Komarekiella delphini-convector TaxID=3050158 RepID=UPI0017869374|nr:hypothetical protein [Komarekiella delphini-convector]